jgi:hypothetical protein
MAGGVCFGCRGILCSCSADGRSIAGIPNFWNVVSNAGGSILSASKYRDRRNRLSYLGDAVEVAAQHRPRGPLPEKLRDSLAGHSVTGGDLSARPSVDEIEQHHSPLNVRAMQMRKDRYLGWK